MWADGGNVAATAQGFLGVNTIKLPGGLPVMAKNDSKRLFGKELLS